jgi:hypothetical protein
MSIPVKRTPLILRPDPSRVLLRPFTPGDSERVGRIIDSRGVRGAPAVGDLRRVL